LALQLVIVGLPQSGKTTVFNALTGADATTGGFSSSEGEPNLATVKVPDDRLDVLTAMFNPKRTVPAEVRYLDVAGVAKGVGKQGLGGRLLAHLAESDALILVVRAFQNENVPHPDETVDPLRDIDTLLLELVFSDLGIVEKRLARIEATISKVRGAEREANEREASILRRCQEALESNQPIRALGLDEDEERVIRGFGFLTQKPALLLFNIGEEQLGAGVETLLDEARGRFGSNSGIAFGALAAQIEMEIGQLDPEDAAVFMADLGIRESSLGRVIRDSYHLLGLITFLTVGPDEVRAWPIRDGWTAAEAAGEIHSDIARGFIRAEVTAYQDLITHKTLAECRKAGVLRAEGRDYVMRDGDITNFLFNV
jgi:hypothetical protein